MSGFVGILHLDGAPVDRALLTALTVSMTYRGPDAQRTWVSDRVGFGHTLLRTADDAEREQQPFTLDGAVWIVADGRIDAQQELIAKLNARGEAVTRGATDVELLLRAYRSWGEDCTAHLLGDFAFAVWDGSARRLFCARDQLGVKPFFYAHVGQTVVFSNTLDCLRQHPAVSNKLNDQAIADFLLFDVNENPATTTFADIQSLPPAHHVTWTDQGLSVRRYWTMPVDEPVFFARPDDYPDHFAELIRGAVSDRLRTDKLSVFMSGGLDSSSLARVSCDLLRERTASCGVRAFTTIVDGLDRNERHYAQLVARHLDIPMSITDLSDTFIDPHWHQAPLHTAEPVPNPTQLTIRRAQFRDAAAHARVGFYGEGPDDALRYEWQPYLSYLVKTRRVARLVREVSAHVLRHRRIPILPFVPRTLRDWRRRDPWRQPFPGWLEPTFESRLHLRERWEQHHHGAPAPAPHPVRPLSYEALSSPMWEPLFRSFDAEATGAAFEVRHPYVDLRVLRFALSVPPVPWCRQKLILRRAMRGLLPEPVLQRSKASLTSDPAWEGARRFGLPRLRPAPELAAYVDAGRVPAEPSNGMIAFRVDFRPFALNYWLSNSRSKSNGASTCAGPGDQDISVAR